MELRTKLYFIRCHGMVKVGVARDVEKRFIGIQTGNPYELELMATMPGTREMEKRLHNLFWEFHVRGEWFILNEDIQRLIDYINETDRDIALKDVYDVLGWDYNAAETRNDEEWARQARELEGMTALAN